MAELAVFRDRIQVTSVLIVVCFLGVLALRSQSAASFPTYLLAVFVLVNLPHWNDVFQVKYFWLVCALVGYLFISSVWSEPFVWREVASTGSRALLILFFVIAFAECALRDRLWVWLRRSMAVTGAVAAAVALYFYFTGWHFDAGIRFRGLGQLDNPNVASMIFSAVLVFAIDLVIRERPVRWRLLGLGCGVLLSVAIFYTGSRSGWFSLGVGLVVLALCWNVRDVRGFAMAAITIGIVVAVLMFGLLIDDTIREMAFPRGLSFRSEIWATAIERVFAHGPWFGFGISTPDTIETAGQTFSHPHSLYVAVLFQGGLLGLGLLLALVYWSIKVLLAHYHESDAKLALGLLGLSLSGYAFDGHELIDKVSDVWFLFWLPVAICLSKAWRRLPGDLEDLDG